MEFFPDSRLLLSIGPLHITWYACFLLTGIILAYILCQRTVQKWGYSRSVLEDLLIPMVLCALIGARAYYVLFQWDYYALHPAEIIAIWNGGIAMHGAIIGACLYGLWYCHRHHYSFMRLANAILPNCLLGQAIGRWGNFMNQEAYGNIVSPSFYNGWPAFIRDRMFIDGAYRFPSFLVESVLDLAGWAFIVFVFRKRFYRHRGDCAYMYCVWYGCTRLILEMQRTDALMIGPFRQAQVLSALLVTIGVLGLSGILRKIWHRFRPRQKPLLLFDLDGTLIDTRDLVFATFRKVFELRLPEHTLSQQELDSFFGPPLEDSFGKYFPADQVGELIDLYQKINAEIYNDYDQDIPGVKETLEKLHAQGYQMGVVSNKRQAVVEKGLKKAGLAHLMDVVLGKENLKSVKPSADGLIQACDLLHADYGNVIYIGDNASDIQAARNMAAYSIAYSPDPEQREKLVQEKPKRVMTDFRQLAEIVTEDKEWNDNLIW